MLFPLVVHSLVPDVFIVLSAERTRRVHAGGGLSLCTVTHYCVSSNVKDAFVSVRLPHERLTRVVTKSTSDELPTGMTNHRMNKLPFG